MTIVHTCNHTQRPVRHKLVHGISHFLVDNFVAQPFDAQIGGHIATRAKCDLSTTCWPTSSSVVFMPPAPPVPQACYARTHPPTTPWVASYHHLTNFLPTCHVSPLRPATKCPFYWSASRLRERGRGTLQMYVILRVCLKESFGINFFNQRHDHDACILRLGSKRRTRAAGITRNIFNIPSCHEVKVLQDKWLAEQRDVKKRTYLEELVD